jgi:hypothetical protein
MTALLWASEGGHLETVRVLVELGASVEAVDKVKIHAHALAHTCCIKHVSGSMRRTIIIMSHARVSMYIYTFICRYVIFGILSAFSDPFRDLNMIGKFARLLLLSDCAAAFDRMPKYI